MASNAFGTLFKMTTWGESRGKGVGCVVDGCPAGLVISEEQIAKELCKRAPGGRGCSRRKELDTVEILSGIYEGVTTGAPIALWIKNCDVIDECCDVFRPGHADLTYAKKYGHVDLRGGGRASARETAVRVAAGAIAKQLIRLEGVKIVAWVCQIGDRRFAEGDQQDVPSFLEEVRGSNDSLGGIVSVRVEAVPCGLGDPMYEKLTAKLAFAMFSIPASRGFEVGDGFFAATMRGSDHNDSIGDNMSFSTNHAGGVLGGISTGEPLLFRVAFKPTSSIGISVRAMAKDGTSTSYATMDTTRQDPCVALRAVAVVEAMTALVLADAFLFAKTSTLA